MKSEMIRTKPFMIVNRIMIDVRYEEVDLYILRLGWFEDR